MAGVVLLTIAEGIIANVASEALKKIRLSFGFKDELRKLQETVNIIKAVLLDAEEKKESNNPVKAWLDSLEDVIYDADNLVDEFRYQQLRRRVLFGKKKAKKVRVFFSRSNQLVFRLKMAKKVKQIREKLDEIKANQVFSQLVKGPEGTHVPSKISWRETESIVADEVIGRDDDKRKIIDLLLLENNVEDKESVSFVSLVGIGGLGKTTLAQLVFNDELVKNHFEKKMWVCVSDDFNLKLLIRKIISCLTGTSPDLNLDLEPLQNQLRPQIEGKRYLLVLDDVWNDNDWREWDRLKTFLKLGKKGSKVLITTRNTGVAEIADSTKTYMLSDLGEEKSWDLFERVAFKKMDKTTSLVEIGKDIVKKCKGVPLAIKTIGSLLQSKKDSSQNLEREWKLFRDNELAKVAYQNDSDGIISTLKLSYNNLPSHLKSCFVYCSLFPKDHRIHVQQLIKLWMAQGFIKPDEPRQPEDSGYECFMILFSRCFFQEAEKGELSSTTIEYCKMHDLMHDLASQVAGKSIKIINDSDPTNAIEKVFHLCADFPPFSSCQIPTMLFEQKKMRTFILPSKYVSLSSVNFHGVLSNFKLLRALTLRIKSPDTETLPNSLGKLKHLRYLDLSDNRYIKELPNSITELYYLQTLILVSCDSLVSLPAGIQNLINLRHLEIRGCWELTHMPRGIGELTSLQTLDRFVVAGDNSSESAGLGELCKLNNLRGGLFIEILGLGDLGAGRYYLKDKQHLESLDIIWTEEDMVGNAKEACKRLEPPPNIKALHVSYPGETFPDNWFSLLTNLVQLQIDGCENCKYLPPLHHLSFLKELTLENLSALDYVSDRDSEWGRGDHSSNSSTISFLPSLTTLMIQQCNNLKGWWEREGEDFGNTITDHQQPYFPALSNLVIFDCPVLTSIPLFPNLKELELRNTSSKPLQRTIMMKLESDINVAVTSSIASTSSSSSPSSLSNLKCLNIRCVHDLESLLPEGIHNLSSLQSLGICECSNLSSIPDEIGSLSSLIDLTIEGCNNLTSIPNAIGSLSSLKYLTIEGCSNLTSIPNEIGSLSSLTDLTIKGCSNLTSIPNEIGSLSLLTDLTIEGCSNLTSIPNEIGSLSSLRDLRIEGCSNLTSIPNEIGSLSSLIDLRIERCSNLTSIPNEIGSLSSLRDLRIEECSNLTSIPNQIGSLTLLTDLTIEGCSNLTSIPNEIGSLTSLTELSLEGCSNLASIPNEIANLSSLIGLRIEGCSNLTSIPNQIGSLSSLKFVNGKPCNEIPMDALADYLLRENSPAPESPPHI